MRDKALATLSFLMMQVINSNQVSATAVKAGVTNTSTTPISVQAAAMMISTLPIVCIYPFLQKYFVTGMMVGSVKE